MCRARQNFTTRSSANGTDEGGALTKDWYIAYTKVHSEKKAAEYLGKLGYTTYVATQKVWRQWSDRRKLIDKIVIPQIVFVYCNLKDVDKLVRLSYVAYFMRKPGTNEKATVHEEELNRLRFALVNSESEILYSPDKFRLGEAVRIRFGKLTGLTGNVARMKDGSDYLVIALDYLGYAMVKIKAEDLQPIDKNNKDNE